MRQPQLGCLSPAGFCGWPVCCRRPACRPCLPADPPAYPRLPDCLPTGSPACLPPAGRPVSSLPVSLAFPVCRGLHRARCRWRWWRGSSTTRRVSSPWPATAVSDGPGLPPRAAALLLGQWVGGLAGGSWALGLLGAAGWLAGFCCAPGECAVLVCHWAGQGKLAVAAVNGCTLHPHGPMSAKPGPSPPPPLRCHFCTLSHPPPPPPRPPRPQQRRLILLHPAGPSPPPGHAVHHLRVRHFQPQKRTCSKLMGAFSTQGNAHTDTREGAILHGAVAHGGGACPRPATHRPHPLE